MDKSRIWFNRLAAQRSARSTASSTNREMDVVTCSDEWLLCGFIVTSSCTSAPGSNSSLRLDITTFWRSPVSICRVGPTAFALVYSLYLVYSDMSVYSRSYGQPRENDISRMYQCPIWQSLDKLEHCSKGILMNLLFYQQLPDIQYRPSQNPVL